MVLQWDDGTSGVSPTCFSTPASQPSILSWRVVEARAGEHDLEHDGCHAPAWGVFIFSSLQYKQSPRVHMPFHSSSDRVELSADVACVGAVVVRARTTSRGKV